MKIKDKLIDYARSGAISLLVTVLLLVCAELLVRTLWPQFIDVVSVDEAAADQEKPSLAIKDDVLGHRYRPNAQLAYKGPEYTVEYRINGDGVRDDGDGAATGRQGQRILLVGDSFTFGQGVAYEKTWPAVLERQLVRIADVARG